MEVRQSRPLMARIVAAFAMLFGLVTVIRGGLVAFDIAGMRAGAGEVVPVVLWLVFPTGFLYLFGGWAMWRGVPRAPRAFLAALVLLLGAVVGFILHVRQGLPYELRTTRALPVRTLITLLLYVAARYYNNPSTPGGQPTRIQER